VNLSLLLILFNDREAGIFKDLESLLDGLNVIVNASRALSSLEQSLQQHFFGAFKIENELARNDLLCR
jgi:hypothetical protein